MGCISTYCLQQSCEEIHPEATLGQSSFACRSMVATLQVRFDIFVRSLTIILNQDPAHKINYTHSAMAACDLFMALVRVYLYEGQHVYSSYMGGVATRIQGDGRLGLEGCPSADMTRPM